MLLTRHRDRLWRLGRTWLVDRAALALRHVALQDPQLSDRAALARCQDAMQQRLERLKSRPLLSAVGSAKEQPTH